MVSCNGNVGISINAIEKPDYCGDITITTSRYDRRVIKSAPTHDKIEINNVDGRMSMALTAWSKEEKKPGLGVKVVLENNEVILKPEEDVDVSNDSIGFYDYAALIRLNPDDIKKLKTNRIKRYVLGGVEDSLNTGVSEVYREYLNCLAPKQ